MIKFYYPIFTTITNKIQYRFLYQNYMKIIINYYYRIIFVELIIRINKHIIKYYLKFKYKLHRIMLIINRIILLIYKHRFV
jgi:hypothetical protein